MTTWELTGCQACLIELLSEINFDISYISGNKDQKKDSLTYQPNHLFLDNDNDW